MERLYIPNAQKWVQYYGNMAKGNRNLYVNQNGFGKRKQIGGSLVGSQGTYMIPVEDTASINGHDSKNPMTIKLVSPAQQIVEQAKSEIADTPKKGIKRKSTTNIARSAKRIRRVKTHRSAKRTRRVKTHRGSQTKKTTKRTLRDKKSRKRKSSVGKRNHRKSVTTRGKKNSKKPRVHKINTTHFKDIFD